MLSPRRWDSTLTLIVRQAIIPDLSYLITRRVAELPFRWAFAVKHRWHAFFLFSLGLLPVSSLFAQDTLGGFQVERTPPGATGTKFGWNRPLGVAPSASPGNGATLDVSFLQWIPNPLAIRHHDPNDPARHVGLGHPLVGTSWRNRPFHVGWLYGEMLGDELIQDRIDQDASMFGGYRLGWDFDHYWGPKSDLGFLT